MTHHIHVPDHGEQFGCAEDQNVLAAMERARCRAIPVGCRNGGCGACKVQVRSGAYHTAKMNRAVVSAQDEAQGRVLACRLFPRGDLCLHVLGRAWQNAGPATTTPSSPRSNGWAAAASTTPPPDQEN